MERKVKALGFSGKFKVLPGVSGGPQTPKNGTQSPCPGQMSLSSCSAFLDFPLLTYTTRQFMETSLSSYSPTDAFRRACH